MKTNQSNFLLCYVINIEIIFVGNSIKGQFCSLNNSLWNLSTFSQSFIQILSIYSWKLKIILYILKLLYHPVRLTNGSLLGCPGPSKFFHPDPSIQSMALWLSFTWKHFFCSLNICLFIWNLLNLEYIAYYSFECNRLVAWAATLTFTYFIHDQLATWFLSH